MLFSTQPNYLFLFNDKNLKYFIMYDRKFSSMALRNDKSYNEILFCLKNYAKFAAQILVLFASSRHSLLRNDSKDPSKILHNVKSHSILFLFCLENVKTSLYCVPHKKIECIT